jgi:hypothetical protein
MKKVTKIRSRKAAIAGIKRRNKDKAREPKRALFRRREKEASFLMNAERKIKSLRNANKRTQLGRGKLSLLYRLCNKVKGFVK